MLINTPFFKKQTNKQKKPSFFSSSFYYHWPLFCHITNITVLNFPTPTSTLLCVSLCFNRAMHLSQLNSFLIASFSSIISVYEEKKTGRDTHVYFCFYILKYCTQESTSVLQRVHEKKKISKVQCSTVFCWQSCCQ